MCRENHLYLLILLVGLLLSCVVGVLRGQEQSGPWYLISEQELRSIEQYREQSEAERQSWLLQARALRTKAENSEARSVRLEMESVNLNQQLSTARAQNKTLQQSYEQSETEKLTLLSLKNGEIAGLKQEAEHYKSKAALRNVIIISLLGALAGYLAFRVLRFLRIIPV